MMTALYDLGSDKITKMINELYNRGEIQEDFSKSILIMLPEKREAKKFELHGTISLMSHII